MPSKFVRNPYKSKAARQAAYMARTRTGRYAKASAARYVSPRKAITEGKFFDTVNGVEELVSAGSVSLLDGIGTGTSVNTREGQKWRDIGVQLRGKIVTDSTTVTALAKWMLVWDAQPNLALATVASILDANSGTSPITQLANRDGNRRFTVLRSRTYTIAGNDTTAGQATDSSVYYVDEYVKLPKWCTVQTTGADTTGAIGNRVSGALLLVNMSDQVSGTTAPDFDWTTRVSFIDE